MLQQLGIHRFTLWKVSYWQPLLWKLECFTYFVGRATLLSTPELHCCTSLESMLNVVCDHMRAVLVKTQKSAKRHGVWDSPPTPAQIRTHACIHTHRTMQYEAYCAMANPDFLMPIFCLWAGLLEDFSVDGAFRYIAYVTHSLSLLAKTHGNETVPSSEQEFVGNWMLCNFHNLPRFHL